MSNDHRKRGSRSRHRGKTKNIGKDWIEQCGSCNSKKLTFSRSNRSATCENCGETHTFTPPPSRDQRDPLYMSDTEPL